jgi:hypothetical protein
MSFRNAVFVGLVLALGASETVTAARANDDTKEDNAQTIRVSRADKAACMPDALRYCRDAVPNVREVLMCFDRNRDKISTGCRAVLVSYGLQ